MHVSASAMCTIPFNTWQTCTMEEEVVRCFRCMWHLQFHTAGNVFSESLVQNRILNRSKPWNMLKRPCQARPAAYIYELSVGWVAATSLCLTSCSHPSPFTRKSKKRMPASVQTCRSPSFILLAKANRNAKGRLKTMHHSITACQHPNLSLTKPSWWKLSSQVPILCLTKGPKVFLNTRASGISTICTKTHVQNAKAFC